ncbi:MAG: nucleotidyl transferase AbiEii/AbiGii toxin family protein [Candidatus Thermoplasmatota archaeon]|nr:nucleotidyl transferase AbiEii/AbiGii toxin family protein [Candidatus Thermoplasmatota archaeon]
MMLDRKELKKISRMSGMRPHQQEKHYILSLALRSIFSSFNPVFKGGTAIMFFHGLNRFSEDLDFTCPAEFDADSLLQIVKEDMEMMGISAQNKIITDDDVSFSFRMGVEGPLFTKEIERCFMRVEISRREEVILAPETMFFKYDYPDLLPFSVSVMDIKEMTAEKVRAVMTRNKARDLFDLFFLLERGAQVQKSMIDKKLSYYDVTFEETSFVEGLENKRDIWVSELKPMLFGELPKFDTVKEQVLKILVR